MTTSLSLATLGHLGSPTSLTLVALGHLAPDLVIVIVNPRPTEGMLGYPGGGLVKYIYVERLQPGDQPSAPSPNTDTPYPDVTSSGGVHLGGASPDKIYPARIP